MRTRDLIELATAITRRGASDGFDFSFSGYELGVGARHPTTTVSGSATSALRSLPEGVVADTDLPARAEQIDVRHIDRQGVNDNLDFRIARTVRLVEQLRREGRTVHAGLAHHLRPKTYSW